MPGQVLHLGAAVVCPHGGHVSVVAPNTRTRVNGNPTLQISDLCLVTGCPATPRPCYQVTWSAPATRVLVSGQPVLTSASVGQCLSADGVPQGRAMVASVQQRVIAQ
jgi:hypothetical protein